MRTGFRHGGVALAVILAAAACSSKAPTQPSPPPSCSFTLSKTSLDLGAGGGSDSVAVATAAGCAWTASLEGGWTTITSGSSGTGNGTVTVAAAANTSSAQRTGTLTIAGQQLQVRQEGAACEATIAPIAASYGQQGGSGPIAVNTPNGCQWTAASGAGWVVISGGNSGSGSGTLTYTVAANGDQAARTTTVSVAGKAHTITQSGAPTPCTLDIAPSDAAFPKEGGSGTIALTTPAHCNWSAASNAPWLTITSAASGFGSATLAYSVAATNELTPRTGVITSGSRTFTVTQAGDQALCLYSVSPVEFSPCMSVPFEMAAVVTTQPGCTWTATPQAPWISVAGGSSGIGPGTVRFRVIDNYDEPRFGQIFVRWPTPSAGQNLRVSQAGCRYALSLSAFSFTAAGGTGQFDVLQVADPITCGSATQDRCVWSAVADVPWITITTLMPTSGDNRVNFVVAPNGGAARNGTIRVRDKVVHVSQAGG